MFVEDRYVLAIPFRDITAERVPKVLSKLTYFFLKNGLALHVKVTRKKVFL